MKFLPALMILMVVSALSACAPKSAPSRGHSDGDTKMAAPQDITLMAPPEQASAPPIAASALPQLAYTYQYRFSAAKDNIESLVAADQAACDKAGPAQCQLLSLTSENYEDQNMLSRSLDLRVSPAWLKTYQSGLDGTLKTHHARITSQSISSEDLSLQIVDTEARIKNKEALRDRLQTLIKSGNGKVAELIEAETQLANTQAEIDSARSQLLVMQKRIATVHLTLTYQSEAVAASHGTFEPVFEAFKAFLSNMMAMVAFLITLLSYNLPLLLLGIPVFIYARKWWLARKETRAAKTTKV